MGNPGDIRAHGNGHAEAAAVDAAFLHQELAGIYAELRAIAHNLIRGERPGHTLQPTALVNEAYLRVVGSKSLDVARRTQFLGCAARAMRQALVDHARARDAQKRGGGERPARLEDSVAISGDSAIDVLELEEALTRLEAVEPREARVVEARYFAGMSVAETALWLGVSERTVDADWRTARAWLRRELTRGDTSHG